MFDNLENVEVQEQQAYLQEGVHKVKIMEVKSSAQREGYTGTPYTEFKVQNQRGIAYLKLSGADEKTSAAAVDVRKKIFKRFLMAAGAKTFTNPAIACKEAVGSVIEVILGKREYWTNDKDTGEPVIKSVMDYKMAGPEGSNLVFDHTKHNKPLSPSDSAAYKAAHEAFLNASTGGVADDNMPF